MTCHGSTALSRGVFIWLLVVSVCAPTVVMSQTREAAAESAKTWLDRHAEIEAFLASAPVERVEEMPIGVTKPKRAYFEAGGPVESVAWKPLRPGIYQGFWESYRSEIAAYELDKLLRLDMVPVTVERHIDREIGAAIMWVAPVRMWKAGESPNPTNPAAWDVQVIRMKMFDNLINNIDRNAGNLLVDPAFNLILIDHSRAFTAGRKLPVPMTRIDVDLWERMQALAEEDLQSALRPWLGRREIRGILERREVMAKTIADMVAKRGERAVFVRAMN
jgi:hypothetical protein